jgi:hypothetical protein
MFANHHFVMRLLFVSLVTCFHLSARVAFSQEDLDCATAALHTFCALNSHPVHIEQIQGVLSNRKSSFHSLAEVQAATLALGIPVKVQQFEPGHTPRDMPLIAYVESASVGHYVVINPIGSKHQFAQLLDYPHAINIMEYSQIERLQNWTGVVFVPFSTTDRVILYIKFACWAAFFVSVMLLLSSRFRERITQ